MHTGTHGGSVAPRGVPASVTAFGFGGHPGFRGVPPSVTSLGFGTHFRPVPPNTRPFGFRPFPIRNRPFGDTRRGRFSGFPGGFGGAYAVPYAYPFPYYAGDYSGDPQGYYMDDPPPAADPQAQRQDDARQQLEEDYRAELNAERQPAPSADPVTSQPSTVLVFKDGHQLEVGNYAIVGTTLYDLSEGHSKKVQLADLDLNATLKENDQRGVEFQLPAGTNLD